MSNRAHMFFISADRPKPQNTASVSLRPRTPRVPAWLGVVSNTPQHIAHSLAGTGSSCSCTRLNVVTVSPRFTGRLLTLGAVGDVVSSASLLSLSLTSRDRRAVVNA